MKEISLSRGKVALVDDCDFEELNQFKWYAHRSGKTFYAQRLDNTKPNRPTVKMHRQILGLTKGDGKFCDHRDHDGLNNQRYNLRICTKAENTRNQKTRTQTKSSKYKGVSWDKGNKKWRSFISVNGKNIRLGRFNSEEEAAKAYDEAAKKYHGEFSCLNSPSAFPQA